MADENAKPQVSLTTVKNEVKKLLKEEKLEDMIEVTKNARGVTMKIPGDFAFPSGTANVSGEIKALLIKMVPTMKKATYAIAVEGHTDNIPMRSAIFKSNWELSASRASAVVRYLISEGVDARKFRAIGFGDTQPKFPNDTRANQAKNRRVDITFLTVG
jgi:chemotaxis protein MotB